MPKEVGVYTCAPEKVTRMNVFRDLAVQYPIYFAGVFSPVYGDAEGRSSEIFLVGHGAEKVSADGIVREDFARPL